MSERIRILHITGSMPIGGAGKLTRFVIEGLPRDRFEACLLCLRGGGPQADALMTAGYDVKILRAGRKLESLLRLPLILWQVYHTVRAFRPHIVHTHMFRAGFTGRIAARLAGVPHIVHTMHRIDHPLQPRIEPLVARMTQAIVVDSNAVRLKIGPQLGYSIERIRVIYNGIDPQEIAPVTDPADARVQLGLPADAPTVGIVASLMPYKGHNILLPAFAKVREALPAHLIIVGDGIERARLEQMLRDHGLENCVHFLGTRGDLNLLLPAMDVVTLPSAWEGFGIILAEAMYLRIPTVTTFGSGTAEAVEDGDGGLLVPYGDVDALADALLRLLQDPDLRAALGEKGHQRACRLFLREHMARQYADLYAELIGRSSGD